VWSGAAGGGRFVMNASQCREETCSALEAARTAGISKNTLLRWLKQGKVPEVARDRNGWRIFSARDVATVTAYARKTTPPGSGEPGRAAAGGPLAGGALRQAPLDSARGRQDAAVVNSSNGGAGAPDRGRDAPAGSRRPQVAPLARADRRPQVAPLARADRRPGEAA
jgi:hypothetical protein